MPGYREIMVAGEGRPRRAAPPRVPASVDWRSALVGGLLGALSGASAACRSNPGTMLGALMAVGAAGLVCFNALSHQAGPHPAPILPKVAAREAPAKDSARDVARPAAPAAPKQAARDAIGELIRADETTASVTPKPDAAKAARPVAAKPVAAKAEPARSESAKSEPTKSEAVDGSVLRAQRALAKLGYGSVKADGAMGPSTRAAIEKFERSAKLPVTGEAAGRTLRELVSRAGQG